MHYDARCVIHLLCFTVAGLHVCDRGDRRGGWCTQKGESSADGLLVAWLLWPSGPLSSDCHSWGLRYRFLRRSHSSKLTPPTKHCLPRPTSHDAICPDRWKDRGLKPTYIFFHWFVLFFFGSPLAHPSIIFSLTYSLCVAILSSASALLSFPSWSLSSSHPPFLFPVRNPHLPFQYSFSNSFHPLPRRSRSFVWIASTLEGIIR